MKVSEQIKWVGVGWFLYGMGFLVLRFFKIAQFEYSFLDFMNMLFGLGLYFRAKPIIKIGCFYLWISLMTISSFPFGMRMDFGIDQRLTAREYIFPVIEVLFLLWFFRRTCIIKELGKKTNDQKEESILGLQEQLAIKSPWVWWPLVTFLTSGVWVYLLPK